MPLFLVLAAAAACRFADFTRQNLANVLWAFAAGGGSTWAVAARAVRQRASDYTSQDLACVVWALASTQESDMLLFAALAQGAMRRMQDFCAQDLANTA